MKYLRGISYSLITLVMFLGIPLLGWGANDLCGFFSIYPRLGYAVFVSCLSLAAGYQAIDAPEGIRGRKGDKGKRLLRQSIVSVLIIILLFGVLAFLPSADRHSIGVMCDCQSVRWLGIALIALGFTFIFWSGITLGRMYSAEVTIQQNHELITSDLYQHIRHPRYLGAIILSLGLPLLFRSWIVLTLFIPFLVVMLFRIRDEEAVLSV
ncbi:MAG: isoprenylcysteine carboxylmethyltransferase family protein, partial [Chloroflexota bacterium]|nr:isoprenylcysteine carboxylmethyltransferase family protein [Chloroflexota bacterium]